MRRFQNGFTIIEMVVAIVIVGILSAVTLSRFMGGNAFNAPIVRDQIISLARIAQQSALGRNDVEMTITPNPAGTSVFIEVTDSNGANQISAETLSLESVVLSGDANNTDSCAPGDAGVAISNGNPMELVFGELGGLEEVSGVAVTSAVRICINSNASDSVCLSPSGFAYGGVCDA